MSATASAADVITLSMTHLPDGSCHDPLLGSRHGRGLPGRAAARRHGQGRHREDHRVGRARPRPGRGRTHSAPVRGGRPPGPRAALRRSSPSLRGAAARSWGRRPDRLGRRLRARHRPGVGPAGVPRHVLPPRSGREDARPVRGDRVRDHDRARRARRAAHRQGLRGGEPQPSQQGSPPVRRDRARRPADRPDRAVPQRQRRARGPGEDGPGQGTGRRGDVPAPLAAYGDPSRQRPGGDAGPGDR